MPSRVALSPCHHSFPPSRCSFPFPFSSSRASIYPSSLNTLLSQTTASACGDHQQTTRHQYSPCWHHHHALCGRPFQSSGIFRLVNCPFPLPSSDHDIRETTSKGTRLIQILHYQDARRTTRSGGHQNERRRTHAHAHVFARQHYRRGQSSSPIIFPIAPPSLRHIYQCLWPCLLPIFFIIVSTVK